MQSRVQSVELSGPAGRLEALLNTGRADAPMAAVVCHPHPPSGGTMHTKAVYHAMKALSHFGLPVLRFNFRGVGLSEGAYDDARGEVEDARAALDWLHAKFGVPLLCAGFSFGAHVGMRAACGDERVRGLVAPGLPVQAGGRDYSYKFLTECRQPKLFVSGDHDEFCPRDVLERIAATTPGPQQTIWIPGADHFFAGIPESSASKLTAMRHAVEGWLASGYPALRPVQ